MRKIAVITGTRADFGLFAPVLKQIIAHPKLELHLIVTGMHLSEEFGYTINEIKQQGFDIADEINILEKEDTSVAMSQAVGNAVLGLTKSFDKIKPDLVLVLGDRGEMLAAAITAAYMNIAIAHLHGGEISGTVDDLTRNAITKFASIHLPATQQSKNRIISMNEKAERIYVVGAPGLDPIYAGEYASKEVVSKELGLDPNEKLILVVQHPNTFEVDDSEQQIKETLEAISKLKTQTVLVYPNSDAGGRAMIRMIQKYEKLPFLKTFKNISRDHYLGVLAMASVMIGNSSSAIIEAPALGISVVNIGTRQRNRERADYIIDVDYNQKEIINAVEVSITKEHQEIVKKSVNPYGKGNSSKKIVEILANIKLDKEIIEKI
ncbi:MAG: UDP-N-acetylglucosamine 2-epimerase (hydrolyzing) [Asgard group archaeon]|nr:UDP-N-acetylglucosamine 2-epimerase (hydrolyzing) [Asgard group archaeon]